MNKLGYQRIPPRPFSLYGLTVLLILINHFLPPSILEAQVLDWSSPKIIPSFDLSAEPPILIADQNRTVHAFSSQWITEENGVSYRGIIYNQWTLDTGWTQPVDILLSPIKEARLTDVILDDQDVFHLVFWGGDGTSADIYYSEASAVNANDASAWSYPTIIGENAVEPADAVLIYDQDGGLHLVYGGQQIGHGLYVINSDNDGETWSDPSPIFITDSDKPYVDRLKIVRSNSGMMHAIWNVYNIGGQGRGIYYASSKDGSSWSEPFLLADARDGLGTQTPTIIEYRGSLMAFYISLSTGMSKVTMRQSIDDGQTWSDPSILFPRHVGVNGSLSLVVDIKDDIYLFFGQRISGSPDIHGMWQSNMKNDHWTEPSALIKGPRVWDKEGYTSFDPYEARAVVSQGNVILVTWMTDPGDRKSQGVFYSYAVINAPEFPVATLQPRENVNVTTSVTALPTPTILKESTPQVYFDKDRPNQNPISWIFIGVLFVSILVIGYVSLYRVR